MVKAMSTQRILASAAATVIAIVGSGVGTHEAAADVITVASFPITFWSSGTIEIRAKLVGYQATDAIPQSGAYPYLFGTPGDGDFRIVFVGNDGAGGGGLSGTVNGDATTAFSAATGPFATPETVWWLGAPQEIYVPQIFTYGSILGSQSSVDGWHTYDLVWNTAGLTDAGAATGDVAAVYLDGELNSTYFRNDFAGFTGGPGVLDIGSPTGYTVDDSRNVVFDDLKIWNGSTLVLANDFENSQLVSSVGPNGTYIAGSFVEGYSGKGLSTVAAPEPATWAMMALGFASLGFIGYRRDTSQRLDRVVAA